MAILPTPCERGSDRMIRRPEQMRYLDGSVLYVGVGAAAGASWREYGDRLGVAGYVVLAAVVAVALLVRMVRRRRRGTPEAEDPHQVRSASSDDHADSTPRQDAARASSW
jgi:hypothetical protein